MMRILYIPTIILAFACGYLIGRGTELRREQKRAEAPAASEVQIEAILERDLKQNPAPAVAVEREEPTAAAPVAAAPAKQATAEEKLERVLERETPANKPPAGHYFVQVGSFQARTDADALARQVKGDGSVRVAKYVDPKKQTWYRVRLGPYALESDAKVASAKLQSEHKLSPYVVRD